MVFGTDDPEIAPRGNARARIAAAAAALGRRLTAGGSRRQLAGTALAGLILGLGSVTVGTTLARASEQDGLAGFFQMLFGGPRQAEVTQPPRPMIYSNLPSARHDRRIAHQAQRTPRPRVDLIRPGERLRTRRPRRESEAVATVAVPGAGASTVCVRLCDGYLFPLGTLRARADLPVHAAACAAACPNAATNVYTLAAGETEIDRAVSPQGQPYRASALANIYRQRRVQDCSCQPAGAALHIPLADDPTLRKGDVVATDDSADVVTRVSDGTVQRADYREASLGRGRFRQIEAKVGAARRDEEARAFRHRMRVAERVGVAQVADGAGFRIPERAAGGFLPVRMVETAPVPR